MKLIVGLGNPGSDYAKTRHNAGFMAVDRIARRHGLGDAKTKFHAGVLEGSVAGHKVMLMQPMTYMNRSGLSIGEAARFYKLDTEDLIVLVDETALPVGTIRIRPRGTAGGHNGLADIQRALGTSEYPRLRIGVGEPVVNERRIAKKDYVLGNFTDDEQTVLDRTLNTVADATETWIARGIDAAMNRYNAADPSAATET